MNEKSLIKLALLGLITALAWQVPTVSAVAFDASVVNKARGVVDTADPQIECDPAPPLAKPVTHKAPKKVDAFRQSLPAAKPKPKVVLPVLAKPVKKPSFHHSVRPKPSLVSRVRQNCHQPVPPSALELAGLPPFDTDTLDPEPEVEHFSDPGLRMVSPYVDPCADAPCGTLTPSGPNIPPAGSSSGDTGSSGGSSSGTSGSSGSGSGGSGSGSGSSSGSSGGASSGASSSSGSSSGASGSGGSGSSSGASGSSSGPIPVPEPGTLALALLGVLGVLHARGRRSR